MNWDYQLSTVKPRKDFNSLLNYSVIQSKENSFCGHVVWDSFIVVCRGQDNILDQQNEKQISWDLYYE